ncbi:thioredoxin-domain-containing protein [Ascodesmis nigricans]|uniref:protein disulfide-isomerase n=1 Tax=Ascodesmis nigricans TaxID=341454 RepID=A0A4S2N1H2_9PEZI|nr:thioredoxin-domain-containing protein [Ascodesmis nigricans]
MPLLRELLLSVLVLASSTDAMYGKNSGVLELTPKNFNDEILQSTNAAIVEFYAPWCGHCRNLKPIYEKIGKSMKGIGKVAAIDCDDDVNKPLCGQYGIQGFPTLKFFRPSSKPGKPVVEDYQGPRTAKAIAEGLSERIPNHVKRVKDKTLDDFYEKDNSTAKAILFTEKGTTPPLWKALAIDFLGAISFYQVRNTEKGVVDAFGVDSLPKIVLLPGGDQAPVVYDGAVKKDELFEFFAVSASVEESKETPEESSEEDPSSMSSAAPPKETETVPVVLPTLSQTLEIQTICFEKKAKTCILALVSPEDSAATHAISNVYEQFMKRAPPHAFNIYKVDASGPLSDAVNKHLELDAKYPQILAINWRGWYKKFSGDASSASDVLAWIDAIKMGEGKKESIPEAFMEENESEIKLQEEEIIEAAKKIMKEMEDKTEKPEATQEEEEESSGEQKDEATEEKPSVHDEL